MWIDESSLSEFVRLAEPLVAPLQARFPIDPQTEELRWSLREPSAREIGDLLFLQEQITGDVFDAFDHHTPHHFDRHGAALVERLHTAALSV